MTGVVLDELGRPALPAAPPPVRQPGRLARLGALEITPKKVKRRDLMHVSRQLAVFVRSGVPLLDALETISAEMPKGYFRDVLADATERLRSGSTFSDALAAHDSAFPPYYVGILRSAELTGQLDTVLVQLSEYIERDMEARRKVSGALVYPCIVGVLAVGVVVVLTVYVLPKFRAFFTSLHAKLPLPTRILLSASNNIGRFWFVGVGAVLLGLALVWWCTQTEAGRGRRDRVLLRVPVLGNLLRHAALERFCRVLASMVRSGVTMPEAMLTVSQAVNNRVFSKGLLTAREAMLRGEGLARPLADTGLFPPAARQMFRVGEDTGSLDDQLALAAGYYGGELDHEIKRFTSLIEPAVICGVGLMVGFVAISLVYAMYGIYNQVHV